MYFVGLLIKIGSCWLASSSRAGSLYDRAKT
jgi:hypothetical protein